MAEEGRGGLSGAAQAAIITGCFGLLTVVLTNWERMPWNRTGPAAPTATTASPPAVAVTQAPPTPDASQGAAEVGQAQARALGAQADKMNEIADLIAATPVSGTVGMPEPGLATGERRKDPPALQPAPAPDLFSGRWASADDDNVRIAISGAPDGGGVRYGTMVDGDGVRVAVAVTGSEINFTLNALGVPVPCAGELSASGQAIHLTCTAGGEEQSMRLTRR